MDGFWSRLFSDDFMPHGHCYQWQPDVLWLHVGSDLVTAVSYYSIPLALMYFVQRRPDIMRFNWLIYLFAAFIFACGTTHLLEIYNVWHGVYRAQGVVKAITALVSVATAVALWPLIPKALAIPSIERLQREVEERRQAEAALKGLTQELEARVEARAAAYRHMANIVESSADAIIGVTMEALVTSWNKGAERLLGYTEEEALGACCIDLIMPDGLREESRERLEAINEGVLVPNYQRVRQVQHKEGELIDVAISLSPILDPSNQRTGMSMIISDIRPLIRARQEAERHRKDMERFTYVVSHDLRSPLINIKGFCTELKGGYDAVQARLMAEDVPEAVRADCTQLLKEEIGECLPFIEAGAGRMEALISAVLKLSRLGRRSLEIVEVDLERLSQRVADSLRHQLELQGGRIEIASMPSILADPVSMEQIIGNLLSNAVKYLTPDRPGEIRVEASAVASGVLLRVVDNGRGVAPEARERIFQPFTRAGDTREIPGEGMGLAYVRALVRQMGGRSAVGRRSERAPRSR